MTAVMHGTPEKLTVDFYFAIQDIFIVISWVRGSD
jgi:hypothetical protein